MAEIVPAIVVANGKARVGTLVQIDRDGRLLKGKVSQFDAEHKSVTVALDNGEVVTVGAALVQRQQPQAAGPHAAPAPGPVPGAKECAKCHGKGERKAVLGVAGKMKVCKACDGTGHSA